MTLTTGIRLLLLLTVFVSVAAAASSKNQTIYRCKGKAGQSLFQQHPCSENQISSGSPAYQLWRDLRVQSSQAQSILAGLGADVESIKRCQRGMQAHQQALVAIRPRINAMARDYEELLKAANLLQACGECRTSAMSNCILADQELQKTMSKLMEY